MVVSRCLRALKWIGVNSNRNHWAVMITYRKAALRIAELWFNEEPDQLRFDIVRYFQRSAPLSQGKWTSFFTILVDLRQSTNVLLDNMTKDTRYEIRRADSRDRLTYHIWMPADHECLARFASFYSEYSAQKEPIQKGHGRLTELARMNALVLSEIRDESGESLVWHAYYFTKDRVRLLHSASFLRNTDDSARKSMLGRANRFHHWRDILAFAERSVLFYDFGGWYEGKTDAKRLNINRFKEEFGGKVVVDYNGQVGITLAGKAALWCYAHMRKGS